MDTGHALRRHREAKGWTQEQAADRMGVSRSHYVKLERGERGLTVHTIELAAKAFEVPRWAILDDDRDNVNISGADEQVNVGKSLAAELLYSTRAGASAASTVVELRNRLVPIPVVGRVEAGTFREIDELEGLDSEPEMIFDEPDPDFPRARRMAFTVQGDSMNAATPPLLDGYRLICVDFSDAAVPLSDGMTVVVQRTKDGGFIREWSVKEVEMSETEVWFCPRSTNPRHKPIIVPIEAEPTDGVQVEVIAIARSVSASIPRYRVKRP